MGKLACVCRSGLMLLGAFISENSIPVCGALQTWVRPAYFSNDQSSLLGAVQISTAFQTRRPVHNQEPVIYRRHRRSLFIVAKTGHLITCSVKISKICSDQKNCISSIRVSQHLTLHKHFQICKYFCFQMQNF